MNPLLYYSICTWIIFGAINVLSNMFSNKPTITSVPVKRINALFGIYFIVIMVLFLAGKLN